MFAVVIAIPYVGYRWFGLNPIVAFWFRLHRDPPAGAPRSRTGWRGRRARAGSGWATAWSAWCRRSSSSDSVGHMAVSGKDVMVRGTGPRTPARPDAGPGVAAVNRPLQVWAAPPPGLSDG